MIRKITANLYMTLDGYGEFPKYPGSDVSPREPGEAWKEMWSNRYGTVDTVIFGRRSFEGHQSVHSERARKPDDAPYLFDYSRWLDRCQKIVLSHSMKETNWQNSRIMSGELNEIVAQLKAEPGKDIIVDGGPSLVHEFIKQGLVDDYRIAVWPVILGGGNHYWGSLPSQQTLKLVDVKTLTFGRLFLHYETVRM
jgi:dihydrofolate reductase